MSEFDEEWWKSVEAALAVGQRIAVTSEELNEASDHIVRLLMDASLLLESGSHATSCFLAITALEETAKVHLGIYRRSAEPGPRKKDPLFRHDKKHHIAASPTIAMGSRLQGAIGEKRMHELLEVARSGGLVKLREASLYVEKVDDKIQLPSVSVTTTTARELLLFAIESFDDALVGYTSHSFDLSKVTDELFLRWKDA
jgi:AbiV family abortive infection protein